MNIFQFLPKIISQVIEEKVQTRHGLNNINLNKNKESDLEFIISNSLTELEDFRKKYTKDFLEIINLK